MTKTKVLKRKTTAQLSNLLKQKGSRRRSARKTPRQIGRLKRAKPAAAMMTESLTEQNGRLRTKQKAVFLATFAKMGTVQAACNKTKVGRSTVYFWAKVDKLFAVAFAEAQEEATDVCEQEARRRGVDGVLEPVYYQGDVVGHIRKYSDTCLLAILNAYRPEKFKNRHELTGKDGGPIGVVPVQVSYDARMNPPASADELPPLPPMKTLAGAVEKDLKR